MAQIILVTGGARSGKSALAETIAKTLATETANNPVSGQENAVIYLATSEPLDAEMERRIARHRARRGAGWQTIDVPLELAETLDSTDGGAPRLVDCLTLCLNNLIYHQQNLDTALDGLIETLSRQRSDVVLVTNEIGSGVVPQSAEARTFRDCAGELNQMVAAIASEVYLSVSGISVKLK